MSVICDAVILIHLSDERAIAAMNRRLHEVDGDRHQQFAKLDEDAAGGTKVLCTEVWAAAFNYLGPDEIEEAVAGAPWEDPDETALMIHGYDYDEPMRVETITQLRARLAASLRTSLRDVTGGGKNG